MDLLRGKTEDSRPGCHGPGRRAADREKNPLRNGPRRARGGSHQAPFDSEGKVLEDLAQNLTENATGRVEIYTERPPCTSCQNVIDQFIDAYPGIEVRVARGRSRRGHKDTGEGGVDPEADRYTERNSDWYQN